MFHPTPPFHTAGARELIVMRRKPEDMHHWQRALADALLQLQGDPFLVPPPNGEDHAPVTPQKIGLPRGAAFGLSNGS